MDYMDKTNKLRLWKDGATKTKVHLEAGNFLGEKIQCNRDFQCICQSCYIKFLKNVSSKREEVISGPILRTRTKHSSFDRPPYKKKKLLKASCSFENHGKMLLKTKIKRIVYCLCLFLNSFNNYTNKDKS